MSDPEPGAAFKRIVSGDTRPLPDFLDSDDLPCAGAATLSVDRYVCPDFFRREVASMWPRVWQFAAREEEIPEPGDFTVYENAGRSFLLARQPDRSVRAFHNVCLHRGRKLKAEAGSAEHFRCPFHGFTWKNDGTLAGMPCQWDFPHLTGDSMSLPEATVARWGGYIFVREAAEGPSLEAYLAPLPQHFARWRHEERVTVAWVGRRLKANWKAALEAFLEAMHVPATHPQSMFFTSDAGSRYAIHGDHVSSTITPTAHRHPSIDPETMDDQTFLDQFLSMAARPGSPQAKAVMGEGESVRSIVADINRQRYSELWGIDFDQAADFEFMDAIYYHVFPNFSPWGGFTPTLSYRFRPWHDQDNTLMEVRILSFPTPGASAAPRPTMHMLGEDEPWASAAELGKLGMVLDQDASNLQYVQEGMKASKTGSIQLADYQESRIRHLHQALDRYLAE